MVNITDDIAELEKVSKPARDLDLRIIQLEKTNTYLLAGYKHLYKKLEMYNTHFSNQDLKKKIASFDLEARDTDEDVSCETCEDSGYIHCDCPVGRPCPAGCDENFETPCPDCIDDSPKVKDYFLIDENHLSEKSFNSSYWGECFNFFNEVKNKKVDSLSFKQKDWLRRIKTGLDE